MTRITTKFLNENRFENASQRRRGFEAGFLSCTPVHVDVNVHARQNFLKNCYKNERNTQHS